MRVVVAEDSTLLRAGVVELLTHQGFEVVGQAEDGPGLLDVVRQTLPDVALVDIRMPPTHTVEGLDCARAIRAEHGARVGVLLLSQYVVASQAADILGGGAAGIGYLLKDRVLDPADLADAIRRVGRGGTAIDPVVIEQLLNRHRTPGPMSTLTDGERAVLAAMAEGRSNLAVAKTLHLSTKTVEGVTNRIFRKLGLEEAPDDHRRVRAVLAYLQDSR